MHAMTYDGNISDPQFQYNDTPASSVWKVEQQGIPGDFRADHRAPGPGGGVSD